MRITIPEDFLPSIKNKHLLLDTCVFIDALLNPGEFGGLFETLRNNGIILVTIEPVLIEFVQGTFDEKKMNDKKEFIDTFVESYLPIPKTLFTNIERLLLEYREDGKGLSMTDLILGAMLMQFPSNLLLLTKNTTEFPTNIFTLSTHMNLLHRKGIHSYGVYYYESKK